MINEGFDCSDNKLTDLTGSPNQLLDFFCYNNQLTSLFGVPKKIKSSFGFRCNSKLLDVSDIWYSDIGCGIYFDLNKGMAILPLIKFDKIYNLNDLDKIHERNRGSSKQSIIDFQYDLIENGFGEHAKWKP